MHDQLLIKSFLRSARLFPDKEIVDHDFRYTYRDFYERVCRLTNVLECLGVQKGDKVATISGNTFQHLELYFAVPCIGAILHAVNSITEESRGMSYKDYTKFLDSNGVQGARIGVARNYFDYNKKVDAIWKLLLNK